MIVYVLMKDHIPYEGSYLVGVFSTFEKAEAYASAENLHQWDIDQCELDELEPSPPVREEP